MDVDRITREETLDGRRTKAAVFAVEHITGKRLIVGCSNLSKRVCDQRRYLAAGRHHNPALLEDLRRDGADSFRLVLLDLVPDDSPVRPYKRRWVRSARSGSGCYNADPPLRQHELFWNVTDPESGTDGQMPTLRLASDTLCRLLQSLPDADRDAVLAKIMSTRQEDERSSSDDLDGRCYDQRHGST